ncbi:WhiB family transcriptional regulator [Streptomyces sp. NBC_00878]|uniref:WhiB family transcriptional regulator n=1 Tax=Streptomyces sp. NBC_00878 TaxID=2975854 RepID=UPI0022599424|nr:WhiB family transcriptional regulator [Streptomyces sp. NBC_00878]MCX4911902.1 WhiB family transcriptional regulator [Streptomyces sp. NBC_00878]
MTGPDIALDVHAARRAFTEHRRYAYRGCAPDPVLPSRMAGDLDLPVDAHFAPEGGESQKARRAREQAAVEVCLGCPVMVACDAYANSVVAEGAVVRLAEPEGVWGGRTALERHRVFIARRHEVTAGVPVPDDRLRTPQKQAVLRALAGFGDAHEVAHAAGLDVRTANWQRSSLTTGLGLARSASRMELLDAAVSRGLLDGSLVVADDGLVPAIPPTTKTHTMDADGQLLLWAAEFERLLARLPATAMGAGTGAAADGPDQGDTHGARPGAPGRQLARRPRRPGLRVWFADIPGQLELLLSQLDDDGLDGSSVPDVADVHDLFPNECLEAAA